MKSLLSYRRRSRDLALAAFAWTFALPAFAQNEKTSTSEEVIELSPFTVNTSKDVGYAANSTLAGTRTNTELRDLANSLDVFTPELMEDLGVRDIQDLTNFALGVAPNAAGDMNSDGQEREVWNYNYMQVRGFKVGNVTRNFMSLNAQFEAYNSERVEFSKGPNAILSGMGDPGGSVNFSTKVPKLQRNAYSATYRTDDLGSVRSNVDINHVFKKNTLAVRLNALWEQQNFYRHPAYTDQQAWHLTSQWRPTDKTIVNVGYENRRSRRASPRGVFAYDYVAGWIAAGRPIATGVPSNNNVIVDGKTVAASSVGMATLNSNTWVLDSDGHIRNAVKTARGVDSFVNGQRMDTAATGLSLIPKNVWVGGANGINDSDWGIAEFNVSHAFTDDFNVELSYGHSNNHVRQGNSVSRNLYVDTSSFGDNAHPGQLYVETRPFWIDREFKINHYRGTAAYNVHASRLNRWLGEHQIAGVYEFNQRDELQNNGRLSLVRTPSGAVSGAQTTAFWIRDYLDPAAGIVAGRDLRSLYYSEGINQDGYVAKFVPTEDYAFYRWRVEQNTVMGVLQSRWLSDHVITTVGLRRDEITRYIGSTFQDPVTKLWHAGTAEHLTGDSPSAAPFIDPPTVDTGISRNYGAVWHATKWLSFSSNYATNVAPSAESLGLSGDYLPQSTGQSFDYGVRLDLFENRLNVSLVKFRTKQQKAPAQGSAINSPITNLKSIETLLFDNGITSTDRLGGAGDYSTSDRKAEGEELSITGNLTRAWTFRLAGSRLVNRQTNIAPELRAYYATNMPFYEQQNPNLTTSGSTNTLGSLISQAKNSYALMNTRENVVSFPASEYNVRLTSKYTFSNPSFLKGFSAGGSLRWASAPIIGYYRKVNAAGSLYYDPSMPYKGSESFYTDLFCAYQRRVFRNIMMKVQVNVSNVFDKKEPVAFRAVNTADAPGYTWIAYGYQPVDGRIISLTSTFSF